MVKPKPLRITASFDDRNDDDVIGELGKTDYFLLKGGKVDLEPFRHKSVQPPVKKPQKKTPGIKKEVEPDLIAQYLEHKYQTVRDFVAKRSLLRQDKNKSMRSKGYNSESIQYQSFTDEIEPQEMLKQNKEKQSRLLEAIRQRKNFSTDQRTLHQNRTTDDTKLQRIDTFGYTKSVDDTPVLH